MGGQGLKFTFLLQNTSEVGGSPPADAKHPVTFILCCPDGDHPGREFLPGEAVRFYPHFKLVRGFWGEKLKVTRPWRDSAALTHTGVDPPLCGC